MKNNKFAFLAVAAASMALSLAAFAEAVGLADLPEEEDSMAGSIADRLWPSAV